MALSKIKKGELKMTVVEVGEFYLKGIDVVEVVVGDPIKSLKTVNAKRGLWRVYKANDALLALHEEQDVTRLNEMAETYDVIVYEGLVGFFQKSCFRNDSTSVNYYDIFSKRSDREGERWHRVCRALVTLSSIGAGTLEGGCVSSTNRRSGAFPFYALEEDGLTVAMKIALT